MMQDLSGRESTHGSDKNDLMNALLSNACSNKSTQPHLLHDLKPHDYLRSDQEIGGYKSLGRALDEMSLECALPQPDFRKIENKSLAAHECGHAVCALANGVKVLKIQNGVRNSFTMYDMRTFQDTQMRKIVSIAGPVAESDFLKQIGMRKDGACSTGDVAHLLEHEESDPGVQEKLRTLRSYGKDTQVARLKARLNDHLMDGKELPSEFQHLLRLIEQARDTLMEHRNSHNGLVAALFDKGGVLRGRDIQSIWEASESVDRGHETGQPIPALDAVQCREPLPAAA
jgi:hypothetical protein